MNRGRIVLGLALPIAAFYMSLGATIASVGYLNRLVPGWMLVVWCVAFWLVSGVMMGGLQVLLVYGRGLDDDLLLRATNWIFHGLNVAILLLAFHRGDAGSLVFFGIYIALLFPVWMGIVFLHYGCWQFGAHQTERFLNSRGAQFFVGASTPWERENNEN